MAHNLLEHLLSHHSTAGRRGNVPTTPFANLPLASSAMHGTLSHVLHDTCGRFRRQRRRVRLYEQPPVASCSKHRCSYTTLPPTNMYDFCSRPRRIGSCQQCVCYSRSRRGEPHTSPAPERIWTAANAGDDQGFFKSKNTPFLFKSVDLYTCDV
jgi:hypothetical protein